MSEHCPKCGAELMDKCKTFWQCYSHVAARGFIQSSDCHEAEKEKLRNDRDRLRAELIDWKGRAQRQYDEAVNQVARCGAAEIERDQLRAELAVSAELERELAEVGRERDTAIHLLKQYNSNAEEIVKLKPNKDKS